MPLQDFLPVAQNQSEIFNNNIDYASDLILPVTPIVNVSDTMSLDNFLKPSMTTAMAPETFDWKKSGADRFTQSSQYATKGFDPYLTPTTIDGKTYDSNEQKYAEGQTWGDVMGNAVGGAWSLAKNTFVEGWKGWANMGNAFTGWGSDTTFMQRLAGSPEELQQKDDEQKAIFNKYAIFKSPVHDSGLGVFNREFVGDMIQQSGFSIGAGAQFLSEMLLTWGVGEGLGSVAKGAGWLAKASEVEEGITLAERSAQVESKAAAINAARMASDPTSIKSFSGNVFDYAKKVSAWTGEQYDVIGGIDKIAKASKAGASTYQLLAMGTGGITRFAAALNSAATESRFEAANTYGQLYGDLINSYQEKHMGEMPTGKELDKIRKLSYAAGTDNFGANTALLMTMNQLEFGNIMSKFGSSSRLMREAAEIGDKELFSVSGTLKGAEEGAGKVTKAYSPGKLGVLSAFNPIRKDFGLGTALWQVAKRSSAVQIELGEGIQEILQNSSDATFRDYYTNLYNGGTDINGKTFVPSLSDSWKKGLQSQLSMEGWQTFLMGAFTGLFISPIQSSVMGGFKKANAAINSNYKNQVDAHKQVLKDNLDILNTWYQDPAKALNEHINGIKVQGQADKNMQESLTAGSRYEFNNAKDDAFTKAAAVAIKTGNYESFVTSIKELGERLTDEQFEQAFGMKSTTENKLNARAFTQSIVKDLEQYHDNWENLKDEFSHLVQPELFAHDNQQYMKAKVHKRTLDEAIEILATTSAQATATLKRAVDIRAKATQIPGIGTSANKVFDVLGNANQAGIELNNLNQTLKNLEGLGKSDKEINQQITSTKNQIKYLTSWLEHYGQLEQYRSGKVTEGSSANHMVHQMDIRNALKEAHLGYLTTINAQYNTANPVLNRKEINSIFDSLMDYNTLNRDSSQYVEALNVLTDPKNFKLLYGKIGESIYHTMANFHTLHTEEAKQRTAAETGVDESNITTSQEEEDNANDEIEEVPEETNAPIEGVEQVKISTPEVSEQPAEVIETATEPLVTVETPAIVTTLSDLPGKVAQYYINNKKKGGTKEVKSYIADNPTLRTQLDTIRNNKGLSDEQKAVAYDKAVSEYAPVEEVVPVVEETEKVVTPKEGESGYKLTMWTHREGTQTAEEADKALAVKLMGIPQGEFYNGLSMVATKLTELDEQGNYYKIKILKNGKPIGYILNSDAHRNSLTPSEQNTFDAIKSFIDTQIAKNGVILSTGNVTTTIKEDELRKNILFSMGTGTIDYIKKDKSKPEEPVYKPSVNELVYNTANGKLVIRDNSIYANGQFISGSEEDVPQGIREEDSYRGMYSLAVEFPNGRSIWLQLGPRTLQDSEVDAVINDINEQAKNAYNGTGTVADINRQLEGIFPAFDVFENNEGTKGLKIFLRVDGGNDNESIKGGKKLSVAAVYKPSPLEKGTTVFSEIKSGTGPIEFKNIDDLLEKVNKAVAVINAKDNGIPQIPVIERANLKEQIPYGTTDIELLKRMVVNVHPNILEKISVGINAGTNLPVIMEQANEIPQEVTTNKKIIGGGIVVEAPIPGTEITDTTEEIAARLAEDIKVTSPITKHIYLAGINYIQTADGKFYVVADSHGEQAWEPAKEVTQEQIRKPFRTGKEWKQVGSSVAEANNQIEAPTEIDTTTDEVIDTSTKEGRKKFRESLRNNPPANKIVSTPFTAESVETIDRFKEFGERVLPSSITIQNNGVLIPNLLKSKVTIGNFLMHLNDLKAVNGVIQVYENTPAKYHEAFHAVYRLLSTQAQIDSLLAEARKAHPITEEGIEELRNLSDDTKRLTRKQLEDLYLEEWMADKFDAYMTNKNIRVSSGIKGLFNKIIEWIKSVLNKLTGAQMLTTFSDIDRGKYKNSTIQSNEFTEALIDDPNAFTIPATKIIVVGEETLPNGVKVDKVIPQQTSDRLVSTITALFDEAVRNSGVAEYNKNKILDNILNQYRDTYDMDLPSTGNGRVDYDEKLDSIESEDARQEYIRSIEKMYALFSQDKARTAIKEAVDTSLRIIGYKQELEDDAMEALSDEYGPRAADNFNDKNNGISSAPEGKAKELRKFIAGTTVPYVDEFGNTHYQNGTPIIQAVNAGNVYNGMLKLLAGVSNMDTQLARILLYRDNNMEDGKIVTNKATVATINRLLEYTGYNEQTKQFTKNQEMVNLFLKGFSTYAANYVFTQIDPRTGKYVVSYSNTKDAARSQVDIWAQAFSAGYRQKMIEQKSVTGYAKVYGENSQGIKSFKTALNATGVKTKIDDIPLRELSQKISTQLKKELGINLHPNYIAFSIIAGKNEDVRTKDQKETYAGFKDVTPIKVDELSSNIGLPLTNGKNPFEKSDNNAPLNYLLAIAAENSLFDETIGTMTFTTADNEIRYSHTYANFYFESVAELNDPNVIADAMADIDKKFSFLLSTPEFKHLVDNKMLKVDITDGLKKANLVENGIQDNTIVGSTYNDFIKRENMAYLMGMYDIARQKDAKVVTGTGKDDFFYRTKHLLRTVESKGTGYLVSLPVIKSAVNIAGMTKLSNKAIDILYNKVKEEAERIAKVNEEITTGKDINGNDVQPIKGYHTGNKDNIDALRGLKFYDTRKMLGDLAQELEDSIVNGDTKLDEKAIKKQLNDYWMSQVDRLMGMMKEEGLIDANENNLLAPNYLFKGLEQQEQNNPMGLVVDNLRHNLTQVLVNDYLNTSAINQLLHGNEAKSFKLFVDQVKRAAGANAAGPSIAFSTTKPDWGIEHSLDTIHHITYEDTKSLKMDGTKGDKDDGQMYATAKGFRYMSFGLGNISKVKVELLNKIEDGEYISPEYFYKAGGPQDMAAAINPEKMVFFNGAEYLKCSVMPLTKEFTSYKVGNDWLPLPGMEHLHMLREKMEAFEATHPTIAFAHPESVSKGLKKNIATSIDAITDSHFEPLSAADMRLQLENPSGKIKMTDPTQKLQQIFAEIPFDSDIYHDGKWQKGGDVINEYLKLVARRVENAYKVKRNSIFDIKDAFNEISKSFSQNQVTPKLVEFYDQCYDNLLATGADSQTLEFFKTKDDKIVYDLNFPATLQKYTQLFLSYFSGGVLSAKVPGITLTAASSAGYQKVKELISVDENGQPKEWRIVTTQEFKKSPNKYLKNLKRYAPGKELERLFSGLDDALASGETVYILDDLRDNVSIYDTDGRRIDNYSEYVTTQHFVENDDATASSFAVRIPSDDKHSYMNSKRVDHLPVYMGSTGIFPQERMEKSGEDFDLDKDYVAIPDTYAVIDDKTQENREYKRLKQEIKETKERLAELSAEFENSPEFSKAIADKSKEIKKQLKAIQSSYENGNIELSDYLTQKQDLEDEQKGLGTAEGKKERRKVIAERNELNDYLKELYERKKELQEQLAIKGVRVPYGTATTEQEQYEEYVRWQLDNNKSLKGTIKKIKGESPVAALLDIDDLNSNLVRTALAANKLASNVDEFRAMGGVEINNGVINNRILAVNQSLLSANAITEGGKDAILNQATSTQAFEDLATTLGELLADGTSEYSKNLLAKLKDQKEDVHSIIGKVISKDTNSQGTENIGAAANAVINTAVNSTFGTKIIGPKINIDGHEYDSYGNTKAWNGEQYSADRVFKLLSAVENAMTDNAKYAYSGKYGLNISAVGYVSNMLSQGIPFETAMLFLLQPTVQEYFKRIGNIQASLKTDEEAKVGKAAIMKQFKEELEKKEMSNKLTRQLASDGTEMSKDSLVYNIKNEVISLDVLDQLQIIDKQSTDLMDLSKIFKLTQGLPTTWEDFDAIKKSMNKFGLLNAATEEKDNTIDVKQMMTKEHIFMAKYIDIFRELDALSGTIFLERTTEFKKLTDIVNSNFQVPNNKKDIFNKTLKHDLISFMSIQAYKKHLQDKGLGAYLDSLDHAMIYDEAKVLHTDYRNIIDIVQDLRKKLTGKDTNYMIQYFLNCMPAEQNKDGVNKADSNTWAKMSEYQQEKVIDSFISLYSNPDTHNDAVAMFHYLLVKDGGQFKSGSFIRYVHNGIFKDLLDQTGKVNKVLSAPADETMYKELFGKSSTEMLNDFLVSYAININNLDYIKNVTGIVMIPNYPIRLTDTGNVIVDMYNNTDVPDREVKVERRKANIQALKEKGFKFTEVDGKYKIEFPYSLKVNGKLYKLLGSPSLLLEGHGDIAKGSKAVYEPAVIRGSKGQWAGAGVLGVVPVLDPSVDRTRKKIKEPQYAPDIPGGKEQTSTTKPVNVTTAETGQAKPVTMTVINDLRNIHNIVVAKTADGWVAGEVGDAMIPITSPETLLKHLNNGGEMEQPSHLEELKQRLQQLEEAKSIQEQSNPYIIIAQSLPKILPESAIKETGTSIGAKSDINPSFLSKNGVSVQKAAEQIKEDIFHEQSGLGHNIDEQEIRNTIIEILQTGKNQYIDNIVNQNEINNLKKTIKEFVADKPLVIQSTESLLKEVGAKKVSKGMLNIDGQYYYLDNSKWSFMDSNKSFFVYNGQGDEIYVGQAESKGGTLFVKSEEITKPVVSSQPLIGNMFTREELNDLYKNRTNKKVTAARFKEMAEEYISLPWAVTKEEIIDKLTNCI